MNQLLDYFSVCDTRMHARTHARLPARMHARTYNHFTALLDFVRD